MKIDISDRQKSQTKFLLKPMQFVALLLMGIEAGVSYSHLMQLSGKAQLSLATFITVQNVLIKYKIGVGIVEIGLFLAMLAILWLIPIQSLRFRLTLVALLTLVTTFIVWVVFIEPINTAIASWTVDSFPDDWMLLRQRWHLFHIVRLVLLTIGMSSLISSVLVREV